MALIDKLKAIGEAIRGKTGTNDLFTLDQMPEAIASIEGSGGSQEEMTYILVDENGYEVAAVLTEEEVDLTATSNDIRLGTTAVTNLGVTEGEKFIPPYYTSVGFRGIPSGSMLEIPLNVRDAYDYTSLQCVICAYNTSFSDSVAADKVVVEDQVYPVNSTTAIANVTKNPIDKSVVLGIVNESEKTNIIRYFTYKEEP